tara:strand:- start:135 stop:947 length:813 start_codon:yes stop_codon:yes gene_type:complete
MPKLKLIVTRSTGFDHIDMHECKKRGITVCNVPFYGENTVAEHAFALILSISRKICPSVARTRNQDFNYEGLRGFDLKGKTLGIIGGGHIGMHVANMAKGFEMNVLVFDLYKDKKLVKQYGFKYSTMDSLLKNSDIITLHVPYNKHTHHLINKNSLKKMKKGVVLINTARGGLIETDALVQGLNKKIISFAGLDVLEEECFLKEEKKLLLSHAELKCNINNVLQDHILCKDERVLVTPHNAFNSIEALKRINDATIKNIKSKKFKVKWQA